MYSIVSWNLLAASLAREVETFEKFETRFKNIHDFLDELNPNGFDIICFAELDETYPTEQSNEQVANLPLLIANTFPTHMWLPIYLPKPKPVAEGFPKHGNLVLLNKDSVQLDGSFPLIFSTDDDAKMNQVAQILLVTVGLERLILCFLHLKAGFGLNENTRQLQLFQITKTLKNLAFFSSNVIVLGDFNTPTAPQIMVDNGFQEIYEKFCQENITSEVPCRFSQANPPIKSHHAKDIAEKPKRLDYIYATKKIIPTKMINFNKSAIDYFNQKNLSDHFPLGFFF